MSRRTGRLVLTVLFALSICVIVLSHVFGVAPAQRARQGAIVHTIGGR
jgi:hypothetical protein